MKKKIIFMPIVLVMILGLAGCGTKDNDRVQVTMYLWDKPMMKELTPWLEEKFTDIDFTFVEGYNTMEYYVDLNNRGSLPDIITCRRFSLNDAAYLADNLLDFSESNIVGSFYDGYIENNREPGGAIRWLPLGAEVDGYIVNLDLFEKYSIPLPTNQEEFAAACMEFEKFGIRGYLNDYCMDYSCMEALQGCAIPELISLDGTLWRTMYENESYEAAVLLDDKVWPAVFKKFEQYMKDTRVVPSDLEINCEYMVDSILKEKSAIMRGTAGDCITLIEKGINAAMLPYFGETKDENWLLTYPIFQVAVNKAVEQDEKKNKAIMQVLEALFSEEGQRHAAAGNAVLTYSRNVNFEMSQAFSQVVDCIESNHMYMRLASAEMFAISKNVVQKMIQGQYDAGGAYDDFNKQLVHAENTNISEIYMTQEKEYKYEFGEHGSPAASSVINTLKRQCGDDIAIGYSSVVSSPVFAGDYTKTQLNRLLSNWEGMMQGTLSGAEVRKLMEWLVNEKDDGSNPIRHKNLIPVTGGMEYKIKSQKNGTYSLEELTINKKPLKEEKIYKVSIFGDLDFIEAPAYCNCPMPKELKDKLQMKNINVYSMFRNALEDGRQMEEPTEYVTVG